MKSAILIGDYGKALTHPMDGIDEEIVAILEGVLDVTVTTDYAQLTLDGLLAFDVLIDYMDGWRAKGSDALAGAIISYVAQGGAVLSIHHGIIKAGNHELTALYGGTFKMHPPYTYLTYALEPGHPIASGLEGFEMSLDEEPYLFDMDVFAGSEIFLRQRYGQDMLPAGWTRTFAKGKVCYLAPGHNVIPYADEAFRKLLRRCAQWACSEN